MCAVDGGVCFLSGTSASARNANTRVLSSGRFFCRVDLRSYLSHSEATVKPSKSPCLPTFVGYSLSHQGAMLARSLSAASCSRSTSCSLALLLALAQPARNALPRPCVPLSDAVP